MTIWTVPTELPDLRRVEHRRDRHRDATTRDCAPIAARPGHGATAMSAASASPGAKAARSARSISRCAIPTADNFDPAQVYRWLKDHIAAGVRFVTMNGLYDWGWLRTDGGVLMPPSNQLEEVGALAAMVDENQLQIQPRRNLPALRFARQGRTLLLQGVEAGRLQDQQEDPMPDPTSGDCRRAMSARMPRPMRCARSKLYEMLNPIIEREGTRDAYRLEVDLLPMVHEMRRRGIRIDQDAAEQAYDLVHRQTRCRAQGAFGSARRGRQHGRDQRPQMAGRDLRRLRHQLSTHRERQSIVLVQEIGMDGRT